MIKDTCTKEKCREWGNGDCPFMVEAWWTPPENTPGQPVLIVDCAPKRALMLTQELSNRLIGVEKSQEQMRNTGADLAVIVNSLRPVIDITNQSFLPERNKG